jgi:hypothetical protein
MRGSAMGDRGHGWIGFGVDDQVEAMMNIG